MEKINLYKENRLDEAKYHSFEKIHDTFVNSDFFKKNYVFMGYEFCLRYYLTSEEGMNSSFEEDVFDALHRYSFKRFVDEKEELQ